MGSAVTYRDGSINSPGVDRSGDTHFLNDYHLPQPVGEALITLEGATSQTTIRKALVGGSNTIVGVETNPDTGEILFIRADGLTLSVGNPITLSALLAVLGYVPYSNANPARYVTQAEVQALILAAISGTPGGPPGPTSVWMDFAGAIWLWADGTPILSPT